MKTLKTLFLILSVSIFSAFQAFAQPPMEDVVYLKNGNVYRGTIVEQVPNVSLKVQTVGGNVFSVAIVEIEKITKENKVQSENNYNHFELPFQHQWHKNDSAHNVFKPKRKGYFFNAQLLIENLQGGVRIVNGYKFNRFAYLGVGIGFDHLFSSPYTRSSYPISRNALSGVYFPLYLSFSGDMLNKRVTPFYALEVGYAVGFKNTNNLMSGNNFNDNKRYGMMGGLGLGVKFNTKRRVNISLLANVNFKQVNYTETNYYYDTFGNSYLATEKRQATLLIPGLRLGLGF